MLTRREIIAAAGLALIAERARAQGGYSDRPIRILVGYPAGGGVDIVARLFAEPMKAALGQSVIVENRTGASAMIAAGAVAKSPPDGHHAADGGLRRGRDQPAPLQGEDDLRSAARARAGRARRHRAVRGGGRGARRR